MQKGIRNWEKAQAMLPQDTMTTGYGVTPTTEARDGNSGELSSAEMEDITCFSCAWGVTCESDEF